MPPPPGWSDRLAGAEAAPAAAGPDWAPPLDPSFYAATTTVVADAAGAAALLAAVRQLPIAWAGFDTEFRYDRHGVVINARSTAYDPRSIRPLLLSPALVVPDDRGGCRMLPFVVDLRVAGVLPAVRQVLRLPCPFVGHFADVELFCLWRLGLDEPGRLWDTGVAEMALHLGRNHKRYGLAPGAAEADRARADEEARQAEEFRYTLTATCTRHAVEYPFAGDKRRLQKSFLGHPAEATFTAEQLAYAAADAVAAARLYPAQRRATDLAGITPHLETIEMPWVATNARMRWAGVRVDRARCEAARAACERHLADLAPRLEALGVPNVRSHAQLHDYFDRRGMLHLFRKKGGYSFDRQALEELGDGDEAVRLIRSARRVLDLKEERILDGVFEGADGRVHPEYRHLGTHTGRQTSRRPNVLGLGRLFRPLIVPAAGCGLGEADLCQIGPGVAGAVYGDERLVAMFNGGDVYAAMAREFYRDELTAEDLALDDGAFKRRHGAKRALMTTCTLGLIYGITPHGLAPRLGVGPARAEAPQRRFMGMSPALGRARSDTATAGALRGYVSTTTGLRRYRATTAAEPTPWERNWMTNHPVQGTAAAAFKLAGNRLDRLYRGHGARLLIAVHDAYVFEAPLEVLPEVAELTARTLCEAVTELLPRLRPRAEVNIARPECWNKDGHADAVERWIADPLYTF